MTRVRSVLWTLGAPFRRSAIGLIKLYRLTLSGWLGGQCRFYPTCSHYAEEAIRIHGAAKGSVMAAWRIMRCGPFTEGGVDHVPARADRQATYDHVISTGARS